MTMTPAASCDLIRRAVRAAFARRGSFKPYVVNEPVTVDISFKNNPAAEVLAYLPGVERVDAHSVRYRAKTMLDASDFIVFVTNYRPDLAP